MVGLGFLYSISNIKPIPIHEKLFAVGKGGPNATFNLFFLGLVWLCVWEFDDFIIILSRYLLVFTSESFTNMVCFPTRHNIVKSQTLLIVYRCSLPLPLYCCKYRTHLCRLSVNVKTVLWIPYFALKATCPADDANVGRCPGQVLYLCGCGAEETPRWVGTAGL